MKAYLHVQKRVNTCAVAAVRTVLHWQFDLRVAEEALVALGTRPPFPIVTTGSDTHDMRRMVQNASQAFNPGAPWTLRVRKQGTVAQLAYWVRRGRWPIVQVFVQEMLAYHAVVVVAVDRTRVQVFDPGVPKRLRWIEKSAFLEWWLAPDTQQRWWSVINGGALVVR